MKLIGLTGGIGMGKSTAADWWQQRGVAVLDTDIIARQVVEPGHPALAEIIQAFGPEMVDRQGRLRREAVAARVFGDSQARQQLEAILHPRIREIWQTEAQKLAAANQILAIVVIPLLFETQAESSLDGTVCVACTSISQFTRLRQRDWTETQISQRNAAQWPVERKMMHADYVVWNEGRLEILAAQLEWVHQAISRPAPAISGS